MRDHTDREPHEGEDRAHPASVAASEVVVDGHHMHTSATNGVDGGAKRPDERLPLTGAHLGDLPLVQHDGAEDLLVVGAHARRAARCLTGGGEDLRQLFVERRLQCVTFECAQHCGYCINTRANLTIGRRLHLVGTRVDGVKNWLEATELTVV